MSNNIIDIKAESLPWQAKLVGVLLIIGALAAVASYWWLSIILALIGLALLTAHSGTEINVLTKTFREYNSCLFMRSGVMEKYDGIDRVFINKAKVSQQMHTAHTNSSATFQHIVFNAYLKFDDGRKIFLTSRKDKTQLISLLNPITTGLSVSLIDNTVSG